MRVCGVGSVQRMNSRFCFLTHFAPPCHTCHRVTLVTGVCPIVTGVTDVTGVTPCDTTSQAHLSFFEKRARLSLQFNVAFYTFVG